jgi:prevent-host-death family protein
MKTVSVAKLKKELSQLLQEVQAGEEIIIEERNLSVAKIIPFPQAQDDEAELLALAREGKVRLPKEKLSAAFWKLPAPKVSGQKAMEALRADRDES